MREIFFLSEANSVTVEGGYLYTCVVRAISTPRTYEGLVMQKIISSFSWIVPYRGGFSIPLGYSKRWD